MKERLTHGVVIEILCWGGEYSRLWLYQGKHTFVEQELSCLHQREETAPHCPPSPGKMGLNVAFMRKAEARKSVAKKQWGREGGGGKAQRPLARARQGRHRHLLLDQAFKVNKLKTNFLMLQPRPFKTIKTKWVPGSISMNGNLMRKMFCL